MNTDQISVRVYFDDYCAYQTEGAPFVYEVIGQPLIPASYGLAITQIPERFQGLAGRWVISDRETGTLIAFATRRGQAIQEAVKKLAAAADKEGVTIPESLEKFRALLRVLEVAA